MSLLHPWFLWLAGGFAAAVVGLHFLSRQMRQPVPFPTLRFVPPGQMQATEIRLRLTDWRLLLLRVLIVLLLGLAFAQPRWVVPGSVARLALVDVSAGVARDDRWREAVQTVTRDADAVLVYDGAVRATTEDPASIGAEDPVGLLSPALIEALRTGDRLRDRAETVELTIVSPFLAASFDAATAGIRALWPDRIGIVRVDSANPADMPVPHVELHWAGSDTGLDAPLWQPHPRPDVQKGIHAPIATLIAPFERQWQLAAPLDDDMHVIAWWLDGEPAAVERLRGGVRQTWLGFAMPEQGDAVLRPSFVRFLDWLESPRRLPFGMAPIPDEDLHAFSAAPKPEQDTERPTVPRITPLAPWLLALAILLVLLEPLLRRRLADDTRPGQATGAAP